MKVGDKLPVKVTVSIKKDENVTQKKEYDNELRIMSIGKMFAVCEWAEKIHPKTRHALTFEIDEGKYKIHNFINARSVTIGVPK